MIEQLDVFLGEATKPFVEKLFNAITSEEYLLNDANEIAGIVSKSAAFDSDSANTAATDSDSTNVINSNNTSSNIKNTESNTTTIESTDITAIAGATTITTTTTSASNNQTTQHSSSSSNKTSSVADAASNVHSSHSGADKADETYSKTKETHHHGSSSSNNADYRSSHQHKTDHSSSSHRIASPLMGQNRVTNADKENQPRESRRRRASLRSRSRSRSHSNERASRRSRSRDRRINEREKSQRQFRNKSPPSSNDFRHNDRRRGGAGGERSRRIASNNHDDRSPRFGDVGRKTAGNNSGGNRSNRSNSPRSRSPSPLDREARNGAASGIAGGSGSRSSKSSPNRSHAVGTAEGEARQRCRDFDEKGYCVRGETCPWDHGINPVVFEGINNPAMLSMSLRGEYNPDAPDLWSRGSTAAASINPFSGAVRPSSVMLVGAPAAFAGAPLDKGPNGGAAEYARSAAANGGAGGFRAAAPMIPFPFNPAAVTTPLQRELIPIPVVDASGAPVVGGDVAAMQPGGKRRYDLEDSVAIAEGPTKRKLPLNSRLGPRVSNMQSNCSLELRKVPRGLNSIAHLNNHFAKFGKIVHIQVSYENDPEAAIVTFSNHAEANVAYRSTEAVLNNRFIKVFWHNQPDAATENAPVIGGRKSLHNHSQYHLNNVPAVPTPSADSAKISNVATSNASSTSQTTSPTNTEAVTTTAGNTTTNTTVTAADHTPSMRLKSNVPPTARPAHVSVAVIRKKQEEQAKAVVQLANGLRKRKQELLQSYVKQMKSALEIVERCEPSDPQRAKTLETIKFLQQTIDKLRKEIAAETEQMQAQIQQQQQSQMPQMTPHKKTKEQQKKELLDIELELIAQQQEGNDTTAIQKRLEELQRSLGIIPGSTPSAGATPPVAASLKNSNHFPIAAARPIKGRASYPDTGSTRLDRRPKTIVVTGFTSEEADFVLGHFKVC